MRVVPLPEPSLIHKIVLVSSLLVLACSSTPAASTGPTVMMGQAAPAGSISGRVRDAASSAVIAGVAISADTAPATTSAADGTYRLTAPMGRATLSASAAGYLPWTRVVLVGTDPASVAIRLVKTAAPQSVGSAGGTIAAGPATITVPAGAYGSATSISATFVPPASLGHLASPIRWRDDAGTFHQIKGVLHVEAAVEPGQPVKVKLPVPANAKAGRISLFTLGANGQWATAIAPDSLAGGFATFTVPHFSDEGVSCDAALEDLVNEDESPTFASGDPSDDSATFGPPPPDVSMLPGAIDSGGSVTVNLGDNAPWNATYRTSSTQSVRLIYPDGTQVMIGGNTQFQLQSPGSVSGASQVGSLQMLYGRMRALIIKNFGPTETFISHPTASDGVRGTAFTVSSQFCGFNGPPNNSANWTDVVEVQEGSVLVDEFPHGGPAYRKAVIVDAGTSVLLNAFSPPPCGADAGAGAPCCCPSSSSAPQCTSCTAGQACLCTGGQPTCGGGGRSDAGSADGGT